jgi:hypothetical protein
VVSPRCFALQAIFFSECAQASPRVLHPPWGPPHNPLKKGEEREGEKRIEREREKGGEREKERERERGEEGEGGEEKDAEERKKKMNVRTLPLSSYIVANITHTP